MIVVDTSALLEIALEQPAARWCKVELASSTVTFMSAGTLAEILIVARRKNVLANVQTLIDGLVLEVVEANEHRARRSGEAYALWGKGFHRAKLNYGDCFAYVLARELDLPLLFVGQDFALTDVRKIDATMGSG